MNNNGHTVLLSAANGGHVNMLRWLKIHGADFQAQNHNGDTSLLLAAYSGKTAAVEFLLKNGSHLNEKNRHGFTALLSGLSIVSHSMNDD